jgi:hypothetical protein
MAKHDFNQATERTKRFLHDTATEHHMFHGPTSDEYWSAPLRVLAVNMESYGYEDCGQVEVNLPCLIAWMQVARTSRRTFAIIRTLIAAYSEGIIPTADCLRAAVSDHAALEAVALRSVYFKIRSTSNPAKQQNIARIIATGSDPISPFIRDEMIALEPHVVLVSGIPGLTAFNVMWQLSPELRFLENRCYFDRTLIQSIRHPSRARYDEYASMISNLVRQLEAGSARKN